MSKRERSETGRGVGPGYVDDRDSSSRPPYEYGGYAHQHGRGTSQNSGNHRYGHGNFQSTAVFHSNGTNTNTDMWQNHHHANPNPQLLGSENFLPHNNSPWIWTYPELQVQSQVQPSTYAGISGTTKRTTTTYVQSLASMLPPPPPPPPLLPLSPLPPIPTADHIIPKPSQEGAHSAVKSSDLPNENIPRRNKPRRGRRKRKRQEGGSIDTEVDDAISKEGGDLRWIGTNPSNDDMDISDSDMDGDASVSSGHQNQQEEYENEGNESTTKADDNQGPNVSEPNDTVIELHASQPQLPTETCEKVDADAPEKEGQTQTFTKIEAERKPKPKEYMYLCPLCDPDKTQPLDIFHVQKHLCIVHHGFDVEKQENPDWCVACNRSIKSSFVWGHFLGAHTKSKIKLSKCRVAEKIQPASQSASLVRKNESEEEVVPVSSASHATFEANSSDMEHSNSEDEGSGSLVGQTSSTIPNGDDGRMDSLEDIITNETLADSELQPKTRIQKKYRYVCPMCDPNKSANTNETFKVCGLQRHLCISHYGFDVNKQENPGWCVVCKKTLKNGLWGHYLSSHTDFKIKLKSCRRMLEPETTQEAAPMKQNSNAQCVPVDLHPAKDAAGGLKNTKKLFNCPLCDVYDDLPLDRKELQKHLCIQHLGFNIDTKWVPGTCVKCNKKFGEDGLYDHFMVVHTTFKMKPKSCLRKPVGCKLYRCPHCNSLDDQPLTLNSLEKHLCVSHFGFDLKKQTHPGSCVKCNNTKLTPENVWHHFLAAHTDFKLLPKRYLVENPIRMHDSDENETTETKSQATSTKVESDIDEVNAMVTAPSILPLDSILSTTSAEVFSPGTSQSIGKSLLPLPQQEKTSFACSDLGGKIAPPLTPKQEISLASSQLESNKPTEYLMPTTPFSSSFQESEKIQTSGWKEIASQSYPPPQTKSTLAQNFTVKGNAAVGISSSGSEKPRGSPSPFSIGDFDARSTKNLQEKRERLKSALRKEKLEKLKAQLAQAQLRKEEALKRIRLQNTSPVEQDGPPSDENMSEEDDHAEDPLAEAKNVETQKTMKPGLSDVTAYAMKSLVIKKIGSFGNNEERYRERLYHGSDEVLPNNRATDDIIAAPSTDNSAKLRLNLELARNRLKLAELKRAQTKIRGEQEIQAISNENTKETDKIEEPPAIQTLEGLLKRQEELRQSISASKEAQKEVKQEQSISNLREMIEKQKVLLEYHGSQLRSCSDAMRGCVVGLGQEKKAKETSDLKLQDLLQRKAVTEKMVKAVTKKIMRLRRLRERNIACQR